LLTAAGRLTEHRRQPLRRGAPAGGARPTHRPGGVPSRPGDGGEHGPGSRRRQGPAAPARMTPEGRRPPKARAGCRRPAGRGLVLDQCQRLVVVSRRARQAATATSLCRLDPDDVAALRAAALAVVADRQTALFGRCERSMLFSARRPCMPVSSCVATASGWPNSLRRTRRAARRDQTGEVVRDGNVPRARRRPNSVQDFDQAGPVQPRHKDGPPWTAWRARTPRPRADIALADHIADQSLAEHVVGHVGSDATCVWPTPTPCRFTPIDTPSRPPVTTFTPRRAKVVGVDWNTVTRLSCTTAAGRGS